MPVTNTRPAVLVSAAALNPKAVAMLEAAGYAVINTSGYPGEPRADRRTAGTSPGGAAAPAGLH